MSHAKTERNKWLVETYNLIPGLSMQQLADWHLRAGYGKISRQRVSKILLEAKKEE